MPRLVGAQHAAPLHPGAMNCSSIKTHNVTQREASSSSRRQNVICAGPASSVLLPAIVVIGAAFPVASGA